jgi:cytochrome c553
VGAYYAVQKAPLGDGTPRPVAKINPEQLVRKGDPSRLITPCASCHSTRGQGGKFEAPALAGQNPLYFVRTLLDYQTGHRSNDAAQAMRAFAKRLSRDEIEALATYYADLPAAKH